MVLLNAILNVLCVVHTYEMHERRNNNSKVEKKKKFKHAEAHWHTQT